MINFEGKKCLPTCKSIPMQELIDEEIANGYTVAVEAQEAADAGVGFMKHDKDCPRLAVVLEYGRKRFNNS